MAATQAGARLTGQYRRGQLMLRAQLLTQVVGLWAVLDPRRLEETAPVWLRLMLPLVAGFRAQSADASLGYYDRFRVAELGVDDAPPEIDTTWDRGRGGGPSLVATGPSGIAARVRGGADPDAAAGVALTEVSGSASRLALDGGRQALLTAAIADEHAIGWARVTDATPCAFCALLAGRGPVYKSRQTASVTGRAARRGAGQRYHDHCACTTEPLFHRDAEWPGRAREFAQLYERATREAAEAGDLNRGTGNDLLNAFRRAYEARNTDGG